MPFNQDRPRPMSGGATETAQEKAARQRREREEERRRYIERKERERRERRTASEAEDDREEEADAANEERRREREERIPEQLPDSETVQDHTGPAASRDAVGRWINVPKRWDSPGGLRARANLPEAAGFVGPMPQGVARPKKVKHYDYLKHQSRHNTLYMRNLGRGRV